MKLDQAQRNILNLLQKDSTLSTQALSEKVGMSATPCWRRVREMEEAGVIRGYVALVDRHKVGLGTWLGIVLGVVLKLGLAFAMLGLFVFAWIF